jgi:hypothetical protein
MDKKDESGHFRLKPMLFRFQVLKDNPIAITYTFIKKL